MIVAQETTDWGGHTPTVNHIYFLDNARTKMYAYIRGDTGEHKIFKTPIGISVRGRTFKTIKKVDLEATIT